MLVITRASPRFFPTRIGKTLRLVTVERNVCSMACSFGKTSSSECGFSSENQRPGEPQETLPLSQCNRDVSTHLQTLSVSDISSECELLLARAGIFEYRQSIVTSLVEAGTQSQPAEIHYIRAEPKLTGPSISHSRGKSLKNMVVLYPSAQVSEARLNLGEGT